MVKFMGKFGEQHWPDSIWSCVVYNAPSFVSMAWKVISPVLSAATQERIKIIKGPAEKEINEMIDPAVFEALKGELPP